MKCQHCKIRAGSKARNLCHVCYENRDIRDLYPCKLDLDSTSSHAQKCGGCNKLRVRVRFGLCEVCRKSSSVPVCVDDYDEFCPPNESMEALNAMIAERYNTMPSRHK